MSYRALLGWLLGLWIALGLEAALGCGIPGPLLLLPMAAGLACGLIPGVIVGAVAGLCGAVAGSHFFYGICLGIGCGIATALFARYFSRRNVFVALGAAFLLSVLLCLALGWRSGYSSAWIFQYALLRGIHNALWMLPIYSIILIISPRTPQATLF